MATLLERQLRAFHGEDAEIINPADRLRARPAMPKPPNGLVVAFQLLELIPLLGVMALLAIVGIAAFGLAGVAAVAAVKALFGS